MNERFMSVHCPSLGTREQSSASRHMQHTSYPDHIPRSHSRARIRLHTSESIPKETYSQ